MATKKLTLNRTWVWQLKMSGWIAEQKKMGNLLSVPSLKREWLRNNWTGKPLHLRCFFCEYNEKSGCMECPGVLVDRQFRCNVKKYHYSDHPIPFYNKLVSLDRKRKKKNK